jgi:hypothetical protein
MTEEVRKSISVTLAEIEEGEQLTGDLQIVDPEDPSSFGPDPDASEALDIIERIEAKLRGPKT